MKNGLKRFAMLGLTFALCFGSFGAGAAFASGAEITVSAVKVSEGEKALGKAMAAFAKVKSFAYEATVNATTNGEKMQTKMVGEQILQPKSAFKVTASMVIEGQRMETSIIQTDNKAYIKMPFAKEWMVSDISGSSDEAPQADQMFDKAMLKAFDKLTVKKVGSDQEIAMTVNPKKYSELYGMAVKKMSVKYTVDGKTWLPKKMTMTMEAETGGINQKSDLVYTFKSFNKVKPIIAPAVAQ